MPPFKEKKESFYSFLVVCPEEFTEDYNFKDA